MNSKGLEEYTLAELADSTLYDSIMPDSGHKVVRATDHVHNTVAEEEDTDKMAIFECRDRGYPWVKQGNTLEHVLHTGALPPTNVTMLYPDWDYTKFG